MKKNNRKGFTLIELLTVVGILSIVGTIVVLIVSVTFRGIKKSDLVENAQQNGDIALSQMVKNIRYAASLDSPKACTTTKTTTAIKITSVSDGGQTTYSCSGGTISSNSADLIDTSQFRIQPGSCSFICNQNTAYDPPTITIQFTLEQKPAVAGNFAESRFSPLPFQSSVTLRNQ